MKFRLSSSLTLVGILLLCCLSLTEQQNSTVADSVSNCTDSTNPLCSNFDNSTLNSTYSDPFICTGYDDTATCLTLFNAQIGGFCCLELTFAKNGSKTYYCGEDPTWFDPFYNYTQFPSNIFSNVVCAESILIQTFSAFLVFVSLSFLQF